MTSLSEALKMAMEVVLTRTEIAANTREQGLVTLAGEVLRLQRENEKLKRTQRVYVLVGLSVAAGLWSRKRLDLLRMVGTQPKFATLVAGIACRLLEQSNLSDLEPENAAASAASSFAVVLDTICEKAQQ